MGDSSKVSLTKLTFLILQLTKLIDSEGHQGISQAMVKEQIRKGDVFGWLRTKFGKNIDLSIYESAREHIITNGLQRLLEAYGGDERKKWGLQNNGICLLLGWVNELIQQGKRDRVWQDLS